MVEGFDKRGDRVAGEEIGEEEGDGPTHDDCEYHLGYDAKTLGREDAHVEEQKGGFGEA